MSTRKIQTPQSDTASKRPGIPSKRPNIAAAPQSGGAPAACEQNTATPQSIGVALELGRRLGAYAIMFHQAVADRLGLHITDLKALDLARDVEQLTAGQMAELTGLTTGAITGVLDRLEKAGFIRRRNDPRDRRRVIVERLSRREREVGHIFEPMARAMAEVCARYSPEQLTTIDDFVARAGDVMAQQTAALRAATRRGQSKVVDFAPGTPSADVPQSLNDVQSRSPIRGQQRADQTHSKRNRHRK